MRRTCLLFSLSALLAQVASAQRLTKPTIDTVNKHIVRVMNAGPTAWTDTNGWKLVYERTVQPAEQSPASFGFPTAIHLLADGRVVEVEDPRGRGVATIRLFGLKGEFIRDLGRVGDGPGEYRAISTTIAADTLVIQDQRLARITFMTLDGKPVRSFHSACCAGGSPVSIDTRGHVRVTAGNGWWVDFDRNGKRLDSLAQPKAAPAGEWHIPDGATYSIPFSPANRHTFIGDGSVVYGVTNHETFFVTRTGTDTARIFGRTDPQPRPVSAALRDSTFKRYDANPQVHQVIKPSDIPTAFPLWGAVFVDAAKNFWVQLGDGYSSGNTVRTFDVFSADGKYLGAVASPTPAPRAMSWTADRVAILDSDENDLPRIRIYRIDRRGH